MAWHLKVKDQLSAIIAFVKRKGVSALVALPDLAILHVCARRFRSSRGGDEVVVIFEHGLLFSFCILGGLLLLLLDVVLPTLLSRVFVRHNSFFLVEFFLSPTVFSDLLELSLVLSESCLCCEALRSGDFFTIETHQLWQHSDNVFRAVLPICARISSQVKVH